ncbi:MAG: EAL domain-containing protein [Burkholderiales bacterium]
MRLSITKKLGLSFGAILALLAVAGASHLIANNAIKGSLVEFFGTDIPTSSAAYEMEINLLGTGFELLGYLNDRDPGRLERIKEDQGDFERFQTQYLERATTPKAKQLGLAAQQGYAEFKTLAGQIIEIENTKTRSLTKLSAITHDIHELVERMQEEALRFPEEPSAPQKLFNALKLETEVFKITDHLGQSIAANDPGREKLVLANVTQFRSYWRNYRSLPLSSQETHLAQQLERLSKEYLNATSETLALDRKQARQLLRIVETHNRLDDILGEKIQETAQRRFERSQQEILSSMRVTDMMIPGLLAAALLLSGLIATITARSIARALRELTSATEGIMRGEYSQHVTVGSGDELKLLADSFNHMSQTLRSSRTTREYMNCIFRSMGESLLIVSPQWRVEMCNRAACELLGYRNVELLDQPFETVVHQTAPDLCAQFPQHKDMLQIETTYRTKNGALVPVMLSITPMRHADGEEPSGYACLARDITERKAAETSLAQLNNLQKNILNSTSEGIFGLDPGGRLTFANKATTDLLGYSTAEFLGRSMYDLIGHTKPDTTPCPAQERPIFHVLDDGTPRYVEDDVFCHRDGSGLAVRYSVNPIHDREEVVGAVVVFEDITTHKQAAEALRASNEKFRLITENVGDQISVVDTEGKRVYTNPAYRRQVDADPGIGSDSFKEIHPEDRDYVRSIFRETVATGIGRRAEYRIVLRNGDVRHIESVGSAIHDAAGQVKNVAIISRDMTERKRSEQEIEHLASYDALTGLPNRSLLQRRMAQLIAQSKHDQKRFGVLFIDLDRFKNINDSLGHAVGDGLLRAVAARLMECVREQDTVARLGGDEFVILLSDLGQGRNADHVAIKFLDALAVPIEIDGYTLHASPSIGISVFPDDGDDPESLMKNADSAMYHAKSSGRNNFQVFKPTMIEGAQNRLILENNLRLAIKNGEFTLHYQPQVDLNTGCITGVEALIRWQQPGKGMIPPMDFIPIAEETGLIVPLGLWVLREACRQNKAWQDHGYPPVVIAVNLSARQLREQHFLETVSQELEETGLEPRYLELEITESVVMENAEETIATLKSLNKMGLQLSIDDFGTGYSSLSYLKRFPIHKLKIDRSFVRDITTDPDDAAIAGAVIALAESLGLRVIAEGVETDDQIAFLRKHRCHEVQGYFLSKPLPSGEIEWLLKSWPTAHELPAAMAVRTASTA